MKIGIEVQIASWQTSAPDDDGGRWSYRGETDGEITKVSAIANSNIGIPYWAEDVNLNVSLGDTVYPVIATYETGDTFGRDGGQTDVLDVFATYEKAESLSAWIESIARDDYRRDGRYAFSETFEGKEYHLAWRGYFENFQKVDIYPCVVLDRQ